MRARTIAAGSAVGSSPARCSGPGPDPAAQAPRGGSPATNPVPISASCRARNESSVTRPLRISPVRGSVTVEPYDQPRVDR